MTVRLALAVLGAPLLVPLYAAISGGGGKAVDFLILMLVSQALAGVVGLVLALLSWKPSAVGAMLLGATVGAAIAVTLVLVWRAPEALSAVALMTVLGAAVGFVFWLLAWWRPPASREQ